MILVVSIDILVVGILLWLGLRNGIARALPAGAFFLMLFPEESKILIPGLFDVTTQRIVVVVLLALAASSKKSFRAARTALPLRWHIFLLAIWWAVSTAHSVEFTVSFKALISEMLDYVAVYYLFAKYVRDMKTAVAVLFAIVASITFSSLLALPEAYAQWTVTSLYPSADHYFAISGDLYVDLARGVRVESTFGHPILFGSALAMTIPIAFYLLNSAQRAGTKAFLWGSIFIHFWSLYKTGSRGPWMALALSLIILFVFSNRGTRLKLAAVILMAGFVLGVRPGVWETLLEDYSATLDSDSYQGGSYQYRYALYKLALHQLGRGGLRALWGYGPESFYYLNLTDEIDGQDMAFSSCDSSFAALLIETGYVGFLIVVLLLYSALIRTARAYWRLPRATGQILIPLIAALCAFTFMMTNVAIFRWGQQAVMFWIVMALALTSPNLIVKQNATHKKLQGDLNARAYNAAQSIRSAD